MDRWLTDTRQVANVILNFYTTYGQESNSHEKNIELSAQSLKKLLWCADENRFLYLYGSNTDLETINDLLDCTHTNIIIAHSFAVPGKLVGADPDHLEDISGSGTAPDTVELLVAYHDPEKLKKFSPDLFPALLQEHTRNMKRMQQKQLPKQVRRTRAAVSPLSSLNVRSTSMKAVPYKEWWMI